MKSQPVTLAAALMSVVLLTIPLPARAQKPVSKAESISETLTITAIDKTSRVVTLQDKDGNMAIVECGPEIQRFNELKVGDRVTIRYHESVVSAIKKPGAAAKPQESFAITRTPGARPGGTIAQQMTATVSIVSLDPKVPSATVKTGDGHQMSFKVADAKNLEGYKAGDVVEITYTQAVAISVAPGK